MRTIRQAVVDYIDARAKAVEISCPHDWELLGYSNGQLRQNPDFTWTEYTYRCKRCCTSKNVSTRARIN